MIPQHIIDRVRAETDLPSLLEEHGIKLKKRGRRFLGLCPFHKEKTPSFSVNPERGFYHCFGCHASGDGISFLQDQEGVSFKDALERLGERIGINVSNDPEAGYKWKENFVRKPPPPPPPILPWPESSIARFQKRLATYLVERNVSVEAARVFDLGFDREEKRAIFPLRTRAGILIGCSGRTIETIKRSGANAKYLHYRLDAKQGRAVGRIPWELRDNFSEEELEERFRIFHRNRCVYGAHPVAANIAPAEGWKSNDLFAVEGHIDVVKTWQRGYRVVAPMGSATSQEQVNLMVAMVPVRGRIIVCADPDEAGDKMVKEIGNLAYGRVPVWVMRLPMKRLPPGKTMSDYDDIELERLETVDPGNATDEEFDEALAKIQPM